MIPKVNLLPWRELIVRRKNRQFKLFVVLGGLAIIIAVFKTKCHVTYLIRQQQATNGRLQQELTLLEQRIKKLASKEHTAKSGMTYETSIDR